MAVGIAEILNLDSAKRFNNKGCRKFKLCIFLVNEIKRKKDVKKSKKKSFDFLWNYPETQPTRLIFGNRNNRIPSFNIKKLINLNLL